MHYNFKNTYANLQEIKQNIPPPPAQLQNSIYVKCQKTLHKQKWKAARVWRATTMGTIFLLGDKNYYKIR